MACKEKADVVSETPSVERPWDHPLRVLAAGPPIVLAGPGGRRGAGSRHSNGPSIVGPRGGGRRVEMKALFWGEPLVSFCSVESQGSGA